MFKDYMKKRKERKEQEEKSLEAKKKRIFLSALRDGNPEPRRNTRPPFRLTGSTGPN